MYVRGDAERRATNVGHGARRRNAAVLRYAPGRFPGADITSAAPAFSPWPGALIPRVSGTYSIMNVISGVHHAPHGRFDPAHPVAHPRSGDGGRENRGNSTSRHGSGARCLRTISRSSLCNQRNDGKASRGGAEELMRRGGVLGVPSAPFLFSPRLRVKIVPLTAHRIREMVSHHPAAWSHPPDGGGADVIRDQKKASRGDARGLFRAGFAGAVRARRAACGRTRCGFAAGRPVRPPPSAPAAAGRRRDAPCPRRTPRTSPGTGRCSCRTR